jgi:hypothetical protein
MVAAAIWTLLTDPDTFFDRRAGTLTGPGALAVTFVVALALTTVVGAGLFGFSQQLTGTVTMDNPDKPPEWVCDQHNDTDSATGSFNDTYPGCDEPDRIQRQVGDLVWQYASGQLFSIFLGVFVLWLFLGVFLYLMAVFSGGQGRAGATFSVTAYGLAPTVVAALAGMVVLIWSASQQPLDANSADALVQQVGVLQTGISGLSSTGIQLFGTVWQAYIWTYGLVHVHDLTRKRAAIAAGIPAALFALLALV